MPTKSKTAKVPSAADVRRALRALADPAKVESVSRFFKTGKGQYGEGDVFLGISVPAQRQVARQFTDLPLEEGAQLLSSKEHEVRLCALLIWVLQSKQALPAQRRALYQAYLAHTRYVNNWDLVDSSAGALVGSYLMDKDRTVLRKLAKSPLLWERRIAVIATQAFIMAGQSADTLDLCARLLDDKHDLMHKACGWMLREVGKRVGREDLRGFLKAHAHRMPRTMLRYAIEHLDKDERLRWMGAE